MPDIPILGKYWPGKSPLHRMDPRVKLLLCLALILIAFAAHTWTALGLYCAFVILLAALARIPVTALVRSILPLLFIVVITALINLFWIQSGTVLVQMGFLTITQGGLHACCFFGIRLTFLLVVASLLTLTTTNLDITEAFERLLYPLRRLGVPAHELSLMMGIALRFLPQFILEAQTTYRAQISRGATFARGAKKGRVQALVALVVPLFTSAFRHAETLSEAMDARCYHGGVGRTRLISLAFTRRDGIGCCAVACLLLGIMAANGLPW